MQVSALSPASPLRHSRVESHSASGPALRGRVCDWKKYFFASTLVLLIAQIALTFFLDLPLFSIGLGALGIVYSLVYFRSVKQEACIPTLSELEETRSKVVELSEKYTSLKSKSQAEVHQLKIEHKTQIEQATAGHKEALRVAEEQAKQFKTLAEKGDLGAATIRLQENLDQAQNKLKDLQEKWAHACSNPTQVPEIHAALAKRDRMFARKEEQHLQTNTELNKAQDRLNKIYSEIAIQEQNLNDLTGQVRKELRVRKKSSTNVALNSN